MNAMQSHVAASPMLVSSIWDGSTRLRELLEILARLRGLDQPLTSEQGLRQGVELVLAVGRFAGIDDAYLTKFEQVLADANVFGVVLAIVRYFSSLLEANGVQTSSEAALPSSVRAESVVEWLPVVIELIRIWRAVRGIA